MVERLLDPYSVKRLTDDTWEVDGQAGLSIDAAVARCEELDSARKFDWDFDTYGEAKDGLEALKVGESLTVTYPEDDE